MENNWKLVTTKLYYDTEAEMAKLFCKGLGINLQVVDIEYPFQFRQGNLPLLIIGHKILQKGEIAKYLINLYYKHEKENVEQLFNIFDCCHQLLNIIEYYMWGVKSKLQYNYRDYYGFYDVFNKFYNVSYLITQKQKFHKLQYKEADKFNQSKINLTIIQHWIQLQHQQNKPISIYYIFCFVILKSITYNLRYSQLYNFLIKSELKDQIYTMNNKLEANFLLPMIEGIQDAVKSYNQNLDLRVKIHSKEEEKLNKHKLVLQIITLSLFTYVICKNDFK